jgi:hypothetical protein
VLAAGARSAGEPLEGLRECAGGVCRVVHRDGEAGPRSFSPSESSRGGEPGVPASRRREEMIGRWRANRPGMPRVDLPKFECARCGHQWFARAEDVPRVCPRCKSPSGTSPATSARRRPRFANPSRGASPRVADPVGISRRIHQLPNAVKGINPLRAGTRSAFRRHSIVTSPI